MNIKKIVVIGPESTGKSTLCNELAAHYNSSWVEEYAREFLVTNGTDYNVSDLCVIAHGQIANETRGMDEHRKENNSTEPIFIDTDLYVIKVWSEFVFNRCDNKILTEIARRKYDGYLLCNTDLPWAKDELREYPDLKTRETLFHYYKDLLINQETPWAIVSGTGKDRLKSAVQSLNNMIQMAEANII